MAETGSTSETERATKPTSTYPQGRTNLGLPDASFATRALAAAPSVLMDLLAHGSSMQSSGLNVNVCGGVLAAVRE